jgi:ATPase subunit of ABC transporter with duplicated ATPase domains
MIRRLVRVARLRSIHAMADPGATAVASANSLVVRYGIQTVLDNATVSILEGERVGLVGRNGSGKSTFLDIAAGRARPDSGEFTTRRDLVTGYMPQVFDLDDEATVHANIISGAQGVLDLMAQYDAADPASAASSILLDQINHFDGWNLDTRIKSLVSNLHAPDEDRIVGTLSGGEKRRVALCRALLARPDFLILDEPTNHLDTGSIEWLEQFLARYQGTCLFVTHDRYFLDRVATRIIELSRGQFQTFEGNYTDYLLGARPAAIGGGDAGEEAAEIPQARARVGAARAEGAADEIRRSHRPLLRNGRTGSARAGARRRSHHPAGTEARQSHHRAARGRGGDPRAHVI